MEQPSAVRVRGLRKRYRQVVAVDGLDLTVAAGEVYALLGPNGAGKTTTVEILEGYRRRDGGEVSVLGLDPAAAPLTWRYDVGVVLQSARDVAELTVREAIGHFARFYPRSRDPEEVIGLVGLADRAGTRLRALSGGQRRRVDVALGIVGRPRLLFLDEPTTGFDPQARRGFWELLRRVATEDDATIILTTHYLAEAEALADRIGVITAGRLVAEGTPASLNGRDTAPATVRWREGGGYRCVRTDDPAPVVAEAAAARGGSLPELTVTRPSLEETYLDLVEEVAG